MIIALSIVAGVALCGYAFILVRDYVHYRKKVDKLSDEMDFNYDKMYEMSKKLEDLKEKVENIKLNAKEGFNYEDNLSGRRRCSE